MRTPVAAALLLLVLTIVPAAVPAAKPAPAWPTAQDLQKEDTNLLAHDAACMARYYHGRLLRQAWLAPYWNLTRAEKIVTDAGPEHCMTLEQRIAWTERLYTGRAGKLPQVHCVAVRSETQPHERLLAITSHADWQRVYEAIFRACRLTGAVYGEVAANKLHLPMTAAERGCANRSGPAELLLYKTSLPMEKQLAAIGSVYDTCVGAKSEEAMYRYAYRDYKFPAKIPCLARRLAAALTIAEYMTAPAAKYDDAAHAAMAACLARA